MRFLDLKETSTDITADSIFEKFRFDLRIVLTLLFMQPRAAMRLCTARMLRRRRLVIKCVTSSPRDLDLSCNVHGGHVRNIDNHWVCLFVC